MDVKQTLKEIENTCNQYNFWDRMIHPYGFGIKVNRIFSNWKDYDLCTYDSKSVIRSEIRGFLPILAKWVEYENQPLVKVKLTAGENAGQVKEFHKSTAEMIIENNLGVAMG